MPALIFFLVGFVSAVVFYRLCTTAPVAWECPRCHADVFLRGKCPWCGELEP